MRGDRRGISTPQGEVEERLLTQLNNSIRHGFFRDHRRRLTDLQLRDIAMNHADAEILACRNIGLRSLEVFRKHYGNYAPHRPLRAEDV